MQRGDKVPYTLQMAWLLVDSLDGFQQTFWSPLFLSFVFCLPINRRWRWICPIWNLPVLSNLWNKHGKRRSSKPRCSWLLEIKSTTVCRRNHLKCVNMLCVMQYTLFVGSWGEGLSTMQWLPRNQCFYGLLSQPSTCGATCSFRLRQINTAYSANTFTPSDRYSIQFLSILLWQWAFSYTSFLIGCIFL